MNRIVYNPAETEPDMRSMTSEIAASDVAWKLEYSPSHSRYFMYWRS